MNTPNGKVEARKLKGFRDYLPKAAVTRQEITARVRHVASLAGFQEIDTPAIEYADVLLGSGGGDTDKEVYRFTDHGDRAVALRFDLTIPFARFVTENHNDLVFPFKKLQIGDVWRGEKPQKGRYRQFCQADLDIIGVDSLEADVEVVSCLFAIVNSLIPDTQRFVVSLNNRLILSGIITSFFPEVDNGQEQKILIAIDKLQKIGKEAVAAMIAEISGDLATAYALLQCLEPQQDGAIAWESIEDRLKNSPALSEIKRFRQTVAILQKLTKGSKGTITPALNVARGLGYYTGIVFETTITGLPGFGSVSSGGRYGNLVGRFGKHDLSGVGGSIGVDRFLAALEELAVPGKVKGAKVFIALASEDAVSYAFTLANALREKGIATDIALKPGKLGNQFKYADKLAIPYVVTLGSDEVQANTYSVKHLASGIDERNLSFEALLQKLG